MKVACLKTINNVETVVDLIIVNDENLIPIIVADRGYSQAIIIPADRRNQPEIGATYDGVNYQNPAFDSLAHVRRRQAFIHEELASLRDELISFRNDTNGANSIQEIIELLDAVTAQ